MDPRYPIGRFDPNDATALAVIVDQIAALPDEVVGATGRLAPTRLDVSYREGGWTARQVVHHLADSHLNAYVRFRLGLTENRPQMVVWSEKAWAELPDARTGGLDASIAMLSGLHTRWAALMRTMTPAEFARTVVHPERGEMSLELLARLYAWHGRHHVAHLDAARGCNPGV